NAVRAPRDLRNAVVFALIFPLTGPIVGPAATSAPHRPRTVAGGHAVTAPRLLRVALVLASILIMTRETAARAASFAMSSRPARAVCAYLWSLTFPDASQSRHE